MSNNAIFNATICIIGILILGIHSINLIVKKEKRKDEKLLQDFFLFTVLHFATYLTFIFLKLKGIGDAGIIAFYTVFYIMNNLEVFFLFRYAHIYIELEPKKAKAFSV